MPTYLHECADCKLEWEDIYSIHDDPPTVCPTCKSNNVRRLIASTSAIKVELSGQELKQKVLADAKAFRAEALKDEKLMANIVGEQKYQENAVAREKQRKEFSSLFGRKR